VTKFDEQGRMKLFVDAVILSGSDAVGGPPTSTDNALVRWDGTNGKELQDSSATLSDTGVLSVPSISASADVRVSGILSASVGGDLNGHLPNPRVIAFTSGSTQISFQNIINGELLLRTGNTITSLSTGSLVQLASILPIAVSRSAASVGISEQAARADHKHDIFTAAPSTITPAQSNSEGSAASLARSDHIHNIPVGTPVNVTKAANSEGVAATFARSDHKHDITTAAASTLTPDLSNAEGNATSLARSNHIHNVPTFAPRALSAGGTNTQGTSGSFARSDHVHRINDPSTEVSATGQVSTTSTSPANVPDMSITPGAGTYLVSFSSYGYHEGNGASVVVELAVAGTPVGHSKRRMGGVNATKFCNFPVHTQAKVTVTAGQAITARYYRSGGGGSISLFQRSLTVTKVDG